ncbi:hypothetical protein ACIGG9_28655 [Pseudonocardia alni]|uniref:hypothetical protein n=1 Tax=Pseudonocardia alni TaxID=33907 RepID=UPI0033CFA853
MIEDDVVPAGRDPVGVVGEDRCPEQIGEPARRGSGTASSELPSTLTVISGRTQAW